MALGKCRLPGEGIHEIAVTQGGKDHQQILQAGKELLEGRNSGSSAFPLRPLLCQIFV